MAQLNFSVDTDGIALLSIDVPGKTMNLATIALCAELDTAVERIRSDDAIKGAVLTSGKADFMAGGDIHALVSAFDSFDDPQRVYHDIARPTTEMLRRLETCGKPFAAAINGSALGGGLEMALACHYRVVADLPKLTLALPEVTIGLLPGAGGTQRLPRLIGIKAAVPILLEGTRLTPADALARGIVDAVVPAGQVIAVAKAWALTGDAVQPWDRKGYSIPGGAGFFNTEINSFFSATATSVTVKTQHNLPAPVALLTAVSHGTSVPIEAGLRIESRQFTLLLTNPIARNLMRTSFVFKGECDKLARRPGGIETLNLASVGVVGAGLMGGGLAQVCAEAGLDVILLDSTKAQADVGLERIRAGYTKRIERKTITEARAEASLARIKTTEDYADLSDCKLIIEAVFEDRDVKKAVYRKLAEVVSPTTIIASNTSALPIGDLAEGVHEPAQFVGLHFFSPVDRMPMVEVIKGAQTSEQTLAHALDLVKLLRKTPIIVSDAPGFFTSRVITAYLFESVGMVGDGLSPALIDNAARQAGFAVGPLALMDELTLDLTYKATCGRRDTAGSAWNEPYGFDVFTKFVDQLGRKGRRYGAGFYDYPAGRRAPWLGLSKIYAPDLTYAIADLKERMLTIQAIEAARAFEEGVIGDPGEADVGSVLGIGFPAHTGGVFSYIDTIGLPKFVAACDALADRLGERFRPTDWLRGRAARNEAFHPAFRASERRPN